MILLMGMTYSIVVCDKKTGILAAAVVSGSIAVGTRVPWIKAHIGAIATQAYTNAMYGTEGLKLLEKGFTPEETLRIIQSRDPEYQYRQVAIIDAKNRKAVFTGEMCSEWKGQYVGDNYVIIGNLLSSPKVLESVREVMDENRNEIISRILTAMVAGEEAGGDRRGNRSAAIMVAGPVNMRVCVDDSRDPARKLYDIFIEKYRKLRLY